MTRTGDSGPGRAVGLALALGTGGLLALLGPLLLGLDSRASLTSRSGLRGAPYLWLCDRDGRRLVALDADALVVQERFLPCPLEAATLPGGGVVVLVAEGGRQGSSRYLVHMDPAGRQTASVALPPLSCRSLVGDGLGAVHLLGEGPGGVELLRWRPGLEVERLGCCPGGRELRSGAGTLWLLREEGALPLAGGPWPRGPGVLLDLAFDERGAFELRSVSGRRLLRRIDGGRVRDRFLTGVPRWLSAAADTGGAWCVEASGEVSWSDPDLQVERVGRLAQRPLRGTVSGGGELWSISPGGVERLALGRGRLPGQGGFASLEAVARGADVAGAPGP